MFIADITTLITVGTWTCYVRACGRTNPMYCTLCEGCWVTVRRLAIVFTLPSTPSPSSSSDHTDSDSEGETASSSGSEAESVSTAASSVVEEATPEKVLLVGSGNSKTVGVCTFARPKNARRGAARKVAREAWMVEEGDEGGCGDGGG